MVSSVVVLNDDGREIPPVPAVANDAVGVPGCVDLFVMVVCVGVVLPEAGVVWLDRSTSLTHVWAQRLVTDACRVLSTSPHLGQQDRDVPARSDSVSWFRLCVRMMWSRRCTNSFLHTGHLSLNLGCVVGARSSESPLMSGTRMYGIVFVVVVVGGEGSLVMSSKEVDSGDVKSVCSTLDYLD